MGAWGFYERPTTPSEEYPEGYNFDADFDHYYERESLDERAEQEPTDAIAVEESNDWGAWLEDGERPVPNTGP